MVNRAQRRALRTRKRLLDAAKAGFTQRGLDATTIEEITERADVGKGTFYRHFSGKEDVLTALVEEAAQGLVNRIRSMDDKGSLSDALGHLLDLHATFLRDHAEEFALLFAQGRLEQAGAGNEEESVGPLDCYLRELHTRLSGFGCTASQVRIRHLAKILTDFVWGLHGLGKLGIRIGSNSELLGPLRQTFVAGAAAFLTDIPVGTGPEGPLSKTGSPN